MASGYIIDNQTAIRKLDNAISGLHLVVEEFKSLHPGRLTGDAHVIFGDVCDLIEMLGKVYFVADEEKITAALLALACIENRRNRELQAAE